MGTSQDYDDEDWPDEDEDEGYVPCPHCGETMLEAADHCPSCNQWITAEDVPIKRKPWWIVVVVVVLIATCVLSILQF